MSYYKKKDTRNPERRDGEDTREWKLHWNSGELGEGIDVVPKATRDARDREIEQLRSRLERCDLRRERAANRAEEAEAQVKELMRASRRRTIWMLVVFAIGVVISAAGVEISYVLVNLIFNGVLRPRVSG